MGADARKRTAGVLLGVELVNEHADAQEVHALGHDEEVVMVLNHQPQQEQQLRAPEQAGSGRHGLL